MEFLCAAAQCGAASCVQSLSPLLLSFASSDEGLPHCPVVHPSEEAPRPKEGELGTVSVVRVKGKGPPLHIKQISRSCPSHVHLHRFEASVLK
eukprot:3452531-Amphidinium_carterae.2